MRCVAMVLVVAAVGWPGFLLAQESSDGALLEGAVGGIIDEDFHPVDLTQFGRDGDKAVYEYLGGGAAYTRVELEVDALPAGDKVEVRGRKLSGGVLDGEDIEGPIPVPTQHLTGVMLGGGFTVTVVSKDLSAVRLKVAKVFRQQDPVEPWLSIFGHDDRELVLGKVQDETIRQAASGIVFLSYIDEEIPRTCSGFLVAPTLAITNNHCVHNEEQCSTAVFIFDYYLDANVNLTIGAQPRCKRVVQTNYDLDYSLIELDAPAAPGHTILRLMDADGPVNEQAILIQHPQGEPKEVAETGCQPLKFGVPGRSGNTDFTHRCDTLGGSSGSPILVVRDVASKQYCVEGLHHWGFTKDDEYFDQNRAVRASLIMADLMAHGIQLPSCG